MSCNLKVFNLGFYGRAAARLLKRNNELKKQIADLNESKEVLKTALLYYTDPIFEGQRRVALKALKDATPQI